MSADDRQPSRLDAAKEKVHDLIRGMKSGQAAMVISFADIARVEQSYTDNRGQLHKAVDGIRPTALGMLLLEAL